DRIGQHDRVARLFEAAPIIGVRRVLSDPALINRAVQHARHSRKVAADRSIRHAELGTVADDLAHQVLVDSLHVFVIEPRAKSTKADEVSIDRALALAPPPDPRIPAENRLLQEARTSRAVKNAVLDLLANGLHALL